MINRYQQLSHAPPLLLMFVRCPAFIIISSSGPLQRSLSACCPSSWRSAASSSSPFPSSSPGSSAGCHGGTRKVGAWAWRQGCCPGPPASGALEALGGRRCCPRCCRGRTASPRPRSTPPWASRASTTPTSLTWWGWRGGRSEGLLGGRMSCRSTRTWTWTRTPTMLVRERHEAVQMPVMTSHLPAWTLMAALLSFTFNLLFHHSDVSLAEDK